MLSRLVLLALQLIIGWVAAPEIVRYLPRMGELSLFVFAVVFAVLVWVVGLVLAQVLRDIGTPGSPTLVSCLIVALIGAALIKWLPLFVPDLGRPMHSVPALVYPLIGAVIGYHARR
ncbi:MAG TPA: hypothetical protein VG900_11605 [Hyphomicrobiaceae bacterium]|jgi:hypothetical protein|nr:hypothetical protein [Hyphomicrobiaceae bacterium]